MPKREGGNARGMERRMVAQLLACMDNLGKLSSAATTTPPLSLTAPSSVVYDAAEQLRVKQSGVLSGGSAQDPNEKGGNKGSTGESKLPNDNSRSSNPACSSRKTSYPRPTVVVVGATSRPDALDERLRRAGRFEREVGIPVPDEAAREQILRVLARDMRVKEDGDHGAFHCTFLFEGKRCTAVESRVDC